VFVGVVEPSRWKPCSAPYHVPWAASGKAVEPPETFMSLLSLPGTFRSVNRLRVILTVFARHGFGGLIQKLNLFGWIPFRGRMFSGDGGIPVPDMTWAKRTASAFQELGPTFVKLGQVLSTRPDILPPSFIEAFQRLQDGVAPADSEEILAFVAEQLGGPIENYYKRFDAKPFAAGSIGQAHFAQALDGEELVVKVRRPDIDKMLEADGRLLLWLAALIEKHVPESRVFRPKVVADEFLRSAEMELDFLTEAATTARFGEAFKDNPHIVIPRVRWDLTRSGLMSLQKIRGKNISKPEAMAEYGVHRKRMAEHLLDAFIEQYFRLGIFHADPHPGNLMVCGPDTVALIDFGIVGHLSDDMRDRLVTALLAALERELSLVIDIFGEFGSISEATNVEELKADTQKLLDKYVGMSIGRFALDRMFNEITDLCRRHQVILPRDFILIIKSLVTVGGVGMTLDPDMDLAALLRPRLTQVLWDRFSPRRMGKQLVLQLWRLHEILGTAPSQLHELLRKSIKGQLAVNVKLPQADQVIDEIERAGNRSSMAQLVAGIFIGSSLVIAAKVPPLFWDDCVSILGFIGYAISAIGGLMLLRAIRRSGRLS